MKERIWHKAYDADVPPDLDIEKTTIPDLLDDAAARYPDAAAVHFMNRTMTYRELRNHVGRLSTALSDLDVGPDSKVAVHLVPPQKSVRGAAEAVMAWEAVAPSVGGCVG